MAGNDPQKQLLTLIRDFASEKSQGERRIVNQKKRIEELQSELEAANAELEGEKRHKESTEQELKGYEVELSMNEASIQTIKARIALTQDEISKVGSQLEALKSDESSARDGFIGKMLELNGQIRKFQESIASSFDAEKFCEATSNDGFLNAPAQDAHEARIDLENKLSQIISQTNVEEQEYHSEQVVYEQIQQDLINLEKKALLLEAMKKESLELQELSGQTSELEEKCASHSDELHKRFICPCCHRDNSEELSGILQMSDGNEHLTSS
ncbi:uncharacterized protein LOC111400852 isoform X6 [Olea europaea var. sylvestris]|uniref:uncharacterized protein LOC111400852 isoform X6 n=1 Tax=Olea europaea var. sylvestris TaxID=158386 RepID=UPI000C1D19DB|nr:uncharacterized protein LOC111400852 isoform X6 [Olea europaea var. sylvestris]